MHVRTSKLIVAWECRILRPFWVSVMFKTHWMFRFNIHLWGSLQQPWKSVVKSMGRIPLPSAVSINNSSFMSETLLITPKYLLEVPPSASQMKYHLPTTKLYPPYLTFVFLPMAGTLHGYWLGFSSPVPTRMNLHWNRDFLSSSVLFISISSVPVNRIVPSTIKCSINIFFQ